MKNGARGVLEYTVRNEDLACEVAVSTDDVFPAVFATSRMIGLMEVCAARVMWPELGEGELSVGVGVDIRHFAPTSVDETVHVNATFQRMDGKLYVFEVEVSDRAGKVASGIHTRAIVKMDKIMEIAKTRMNDPLKR